MFLKEEKFFLEESQETVRNIRELFTVEINKSKRYRYYAICNRLIKLKLEPAGVCLLAFVFFLRKKDFFITCGNGIIER